MLSPRSAKLLISCCPKLSSLHPKCSTKCLTEKPIVVQQSPFFWNPLIRAFVEKGLPQKAIHFYKQMLISGIKPNYQTLASLLKACKSLSELEITKQAHATIIKSGFESYLFLSTSLIVGYLACNCSMDARWLFDKIPTRDIACWNAMIVGNVNAGNLETAIDLFQQIPAKNQISINAMIVGLTRIGDLKAARKLFDELPERDIVSANAMIMAYAKSGDIENANRIFLEMPNKDLVSWNSMIASYAQMGRSRESLAMFQSMIDSGLEPDGFTFASTLSACAQIGALKQGEWIHSLMISKGFDINFILGSSLIDMYSKCGRIETALETFKNVPRTDVSVWNSMITGLAIHGLGSNAIYIFSQMREEQIEPDPITFVGILTACSHAGLIEEGEMFFNLMKKDYAIEPQIKHYGAIVDLLGRAGRLEQALNLIRTMSIEPDIIIWRALLSACRIHGKPKLGEIAIEQIEQIVSCESGDFVLLSNIYSAAKQWNSAERIRNSMKKEGIRKSPGLSWIETNGIVHEFFAGDRSHPESETIYRVLEGLIQRIKMDGYVPAIESVLIDVSEEEKEGALNSHSEKLALAFGIMSTSPRTEIQIVKNLRICHDCHSLMKLVSRVCCREIIVRDRIRFHRFTRGSCSCRDYW